MLIFLPHTSKTINFVQIVNYCGTADIEKYFETTLIIAHYYFRTIHKLSWNACSWSSLLVLELRETVFVALLRIVAVRQRVKHTHPDNRFIHKQTKGMNIEMKYFKKAIAE